MNSQPIYGVGKWLAGVVLQCVLAIFVLILVGATPILFADLGFHLKEYLLTVSDLTYRIFTVTDLKNAENPLFPYTWYRFGDSMRILGLGILTAFVFSSLLAYLILLTFKKRLSWVKKALELMEVIPDFLYVTLLQMGVIAVYKSSGIKLAQVATGGNDNKTILLPVLALSLSVSFFLIKMILHYVSEEMEKHYVILARSKGLSFTYILNVHVVRNILEYMFGTSKTVFWTMLGTLMMVEYMFGINGLMSVSYFNRSPETSPETFIVGCILLFLPFFILYRTFEHINKRMGKGEEI